MTSALTIEGATVARRFSGDRLRAARVAAGLTAAEVAWTVDLTAESIHEYERGQSLPCVPVLVDLADLLGVPIDDLFERARVVP